MSWCYPRGFAQLKRQPSREGNLIAHGSVEALNPKLCNLNIGGI